MDSAYAGPTPSRKALLLARLVRDHGALITVYGVLLLMILAATIASPVFRSTANLSNVLRQAAIPGIVAVGQTIAVLSAGIDLSVGSVVKLTAVLTAGLMQGYNELMVPVIVLMLLMGCLIGLLNGLVIVGLRVNPFIATLGTFSILRGLALAYTTSPVGAIPDPMRRFYYGSIGWIPYPLIVFLIIFLAAVLILRMTPFGRFVYAIGGDEETARLAGIRVVPVKLAVYVISSLLATIAGLITVSRMGLGDPVVGEGFELDSITAVVLGGTSLFGGRGTLIGTLAGVLILGLVNNIMNLLNISVWYQQLIKGIIILVAVGIYRQERK